jgi:hypothetical protein
VISSSECSFLDGERADWRSRRARVRVKEDMYAAGSIEERSILGCPDR